MRPELDEDRHAVGGEGLDRRAQQHRLAQVAAPVRAVQPRGMDAGAGDRRVQRDLTIDWTDAGDNFPLAVFAGIGGSAVIAAAESRRTRESLSYATVGLFAVLVSHVLHDPVNTNPAEEYAFTGSSLVKPGLADNSRAAYR